MSFYRASTISSIFFYPPSPGALISVIIRIYLNALLIARKLSTPAGRHLQVIIAHLCQLPREYEGLEEIILQLLSLRQQQKVIQYPWGNTTSISQEHLQRVTWSWGAFCRFATPNLNTFINQSLEASELIFSNSNLPSIKFRELGTVGTIAYDRAAYRVILAGRRQKVLGNYSIQSFPPPDNISLEKDTIKAYWGRKNDELGGIIVHPNATLQKMPHVPPARVAKHAAGAG